MKALALAEQLLPDMHIQVSQSIAGALYICSPLEYNKE
jgi:hypothetical protein